MKKICLVIALGFLVGGCAAGLSTQRQPSFYDQYKPIQSMLDAEMRYEKMKAFYQQHCKTSNLACTQVLSDWIAHDYEKKNYGAVLAQAPQLAFHQSQFNDCRGAVSQNKFLSLSEMAYQSHVALKQKEQAKPYFHKMHQCRILSRFYQYRAQPEGWFTPVLVDINRYEQELKTVDPSRKTKIAQLKTTLLELNNAEQRIRSKNARAYKPDPVMLNAKLWHLYNNAASRLETLQIDADFVGLIDAQRSIHKSEFDKAVEYMSR